MSAAVGVGIYTAVKVGGAIAFAYWYNQQISDSFSKPFWAFFLFKNKHLFNIFIKITSYFMCQQ